MLCVDRMRNLLERLRIATGEQETLAEDFRNLLEVGHVDVVQPDLARAGGLTQARRIADLAAANHALLVPHAWKSGILLAASLHFAATLPEIPFMEYSTAESPLRKELVRTDVQVVGGVARIPQTPGLGVEVNDEIVERYRTDR